MEYRYEQTAFKGVEEVSKKEYKLLLPVKTKDGLVETRTIEKKNVEENISDQENEGTFDANEVGGNSKTKSKFLVKLIF